MVRGSNPGGGEIFRTCPDRPWGPPSLLYNGYRIFPGVKSGRGVTLTPHPLLVPWSRKSRAITTLPMDRTVCTGPRCLYKCCTLPFLLSWRSASSFEISVLYYVSKFKILCILISATYATFVLFWGCRGDGVFFYFFFFPVLSAATLKAAVKTCESKFFRVDVIFIESIK